MAISVCTHEHSAWVNCNELNETRSHSKTNRLVYKYVACVLSVDRLNV